MTVNLWFGALLSYKLLFIREDNLCVKQHS